MTVHFSRGVLAASAAAGPIVITPLLMSVGYEQSGTVGLGSGLISAFGAAVLAVPMGFVFSLVPNFVGSALLAWAGDRRRTFRRWPIYAVGGLVVGYLVAKLYAGEGGATGVIFGVTGMACALICRWGTRWYD